MLLQGIVQSKFRILLSAYIALAGCSKQVMQPISASNPTRTPQKTQTSPIVAILNHEVVRQMDVWPALIELGGQEVLEDYLLTIALRKELQDQGLSILPTEVRAEGRLLSSLVPTSEKDSISNLLRIRGIGEFRKSQLLWRNAALRKLVQPHVDIHEEAIQRMFAIVHGPKYPIRIIVVTTRSDAGQVIETLQNGDSFSDVAMQQSIDSSSVNGGRVTAISCADPSWPAPIRESISTLDIGAISPPIFIGDRWTIIKVTGEPSTSSVQFADVKINMRELATRTHERFLMENLAQRLIEKSTMKIFDKDLQKISGPNANSSQ